MVLSYGKQSHSSPKRKGTLREIYAYAILAHLVHLSGQKFSSKEIAKGLVLPFNATFFRACEYMVQIGFLESEGQKMTKRYWLDVANEPLATKACWDWANRPLGK